MLNWLKFYIFLDVPSLLVELLWKGGILVLCMMAFEFVGALIGGNDVDVAAEWSLNIIWPSFKAALILVIGLGLFVRGVSKRNFLKTVFKGNAKDAKSTYLAWKQWNK
jgi:hypothetical protein